MAATEDSDIPETGAVFTFGKSNFADNLPNKFWVKNDRVGQVACGDEHTSLVVESGRVFMFGLNDWGQLGLGQDIRPGVNKPSCIKSLKQEKSKLVACGRSHTIISTESGHIYSFGSNSEGQLGILDVGDLYTPRRIESLEATNYKMLTAGSDSSMALTGDGRLFVWGGNEDGKLGLGDSVQNAHEPDLLKFDHPVVCVACGYYHTAVVTDDGKLYTMGEAEGGKLGLPEDVENTKVPNHVSAIPYPVKWVACGSSHTVALTESGECYVFGDGENGQLGLGTEILSVSTPTHLKLPFKVSRVFCGQNFTALISKKGQLYTFGDGRHGKLAHGSEQYSNLYKPFHCKIFCHFTVDTVSCGGCHMIVTARTKINDGDGLGDDEADEMKLLESKSLLDSFNQSDGSPSLTRSLSARERRRNELQKSFSNLNQTLPALTNYKRQSLLSATMPALNSSLPKINGGPLNKTIVPKLEALQNGKTSYNKSSDESEEEKDLEDMKTSNKVPPMVSPRRKPPQLQGQGQLQDGSDGDDEDDSESNEEYENNNNAEEKEDEDERKDILDLASEYGSKLNDTLELNKADDHKKDENGNETTEQNKGKDEGLQAEQLTARALPLAQVPVVAPRKKKELEDKRKEEEDSEKEEKDHEAVKEQTDHIEEKKEKEKKEMTKKSEEEEDDDEEEDNEKNTKIKTDKKKDEKIKKKKRNEGSEDKEDEKIDKKKEKTKKKDKKKEKTDDKKKKNKKVNDEEEDEEKDKKGQDETGDQNRDEKDKDKKAKDTPKKIEQTSGENAKNQSNANESLPLKKSRTCVIL